MRPEVVILPATALARAFALRLAGVSQAAVAARGRFALAVPGGSVSEQILPALAEIDVAWDRTDLFFADERAVPPDDAESNYGVARAAWLDRLPIPAHRVHRLPAEIADLEAAAAIAEQLLLSQLGSPPVLDLAVLGVGPDGHVASLFPGHPALARSEWVVPVHGAPKPPPDRLTLGRRTFAAARMLWIAALGQSKHAAIRSALDDPRSTLPVAEIARSAPIVTYWLDVAAAGDAKDAGHIWNATPPSGML